MDSGLWRLLLLLIGILIFQIGPATAQIKFGSTLTLTGSGASIGQNARDGMELARSEINASGGIAGQPLEIIYEDFGEVDLKRAVSAAQKMIAVDKISVLLPMIVEDAEVLWPLIKRHGLLGMAIFAGTREVTRDRPLMFQVSSSDEALIRALSQHAISQGKQSACMLVEQSSYPLVMAQLTENYWMQATSKKPFAIEYGPSTADFGSLILKLRSSGCTALFLLTSPNFQGTVLRQIQASGWNVLRLGLDISEDPGIRSVAGASIDGLVYAKYLIATPEFENRFHARYNRDVGVPAALGYDAVMIVSKMMRERSTRNEDIAAGLKAAQAYQGASGELSFDADGTRHERQPQLWIFRGGKPEQMPVVTEIHGAAAREEGQNIRAQS